MSTFLQTLAGQIAIPMATLVGAAIVWLCAWAARWLASKTKNERIAAGILRLDDAVTVAVREVEQTVVATLKASTDGGVGRLSPEAAAAVRDAAMGAVRNQIGPEGLKNLKKVLGVEDLSGMVVSRIEASVQKVRSETPAAGMAPLVKA